MTEMIRINEASIGVKHLLENVYWQGGIEMSYETYYALEELGWNKEYWEIKNGYNVNLIGERNRSSMNIKQHDNGDISIILNRPNTTPNTLSLTLEEQYDLLTYITRRDLVPQKYKPNISNEQN